MAELGHLGGKRAESARMRRAEQLRRWRGSETEQEPAERQPRTRRGAPRVRFEDGAVFLAACSSGDTDEVKRLLARGADINTANVDGLTALHQVPRGAAGPGQRLSGRPCREPGLRRPGLRPEEQVPAGPGFGFPSTSSVVMVTGDLGRGELAGILRGLVQRPATGPSGPSCRLSGPLRRIQPP